MLEVITDVLQSSSSPPSSSSSSAAQVTSTSPTSMDISETFRPEDLSKTDFFDFVTSPDYSGGLSIDRPPSDGEQNGNGTPNTQPLQGFDQFWSGTEKHNKHLDSTIFEDLNSYCWTNSQQAGNSNNNNNNNNNNSGSNSCGPMLSNSAAGANTDGQIYTLTVLNGTSEPWMRKDGPDSGAPSLDLDTILGGFPGYIKTECFSYDDSGFDATADHHKEDEPQQHQQLMSVQQLQLQLQMQQQQRQQQQQQQESQASNSNTSVVLTNSLEAGNVITYHNNNNSWHIPENNATDQESQESLLRSALQGKSYGKGVQCQNGITIIPSQSIKLEDDRTHVVYTNDPDMLGYTPLFDDTPNINSSSSPHQNSLPQTAGVVVDDMFLTLDSTYTDDYEKLKRIASEVQQFCTSASTPSGDHHQYSDIIVNTAAAISNNGSSSSSGSNHSLSNSNTLILRTSDVSTTTTSKASHKHVISASTITTTTKPTKKYKRTPKNSFGCKNNNNNNNNTSSNMNNNNNEVVKNMNNNNNNLINNNNITSTQLNLQKNERSLHYCSICSKRFKDKYSVNVHIRTHTGEKPFACSFCGKSFRQKAHLAKHYHTHVTPKNNATGSGSKGSAKQAVMNNNNNNNSNNNNLNLTMGHNDLSQQQQQLHPSVQIQLPSLQQSVTQPMQVQQPSAGPINTIIVNASS